MLSNDGGKFEFVKFAMTGGNVSFPGGVNHLWLKPPPQLRFVQSKFVLSFWQKQMKTLVHPVKGARSKATTSYLLNIIRSNFSEAFITLGTKLVLSRGPISYHCVHFDILLILYIAS